MSDTKKMDILLKTGDEDKIALARASSMTVTEEFLRRLVPSCQCMIISKMLRALAARETLGMESPIPAYETLILNRFVANGAIVCGSCNEVFCLASWILIVFGIESVVKSADLVQEVSQTLVTASFALQLQSALQTNADQELEIMR